MADDRRRGRLARRARARGDGRGAVRHAAARHVGPCPRARYGDGRVADSGGAIDCGTRSVNLVSGSASHVELVASGAFHTWKDGPAPAGNRCTVPLDGTSHCVHAFFTADVGAPPTAGECPSAKPALPGAPTDVVAPQTLIVAGPAGATRSRTALFRFAASERGSTFRCKLDGRAWTLCGSPTRLRRLSAGRHVFRVAAVGAAGNRDATPAVRRWRVTR